MFGRRNGALATVSGRARSAASYVDPLVRDEELRRRLRAALAVGAQARRRAKQQTGMAGVARRLATDPVFRAQLGELGSQLQGAQRRAKKAHNHRARNTLLVLAGTGIAAAAAWKLLAGDDEPTNWESPQTERPEGVEVFAEDARGTA
jgi:hypothetical protein